MYSNVVIGRGAGIGDGRVLRSYVTIRERMVVGYRVTVQHGAVISRDGFGFTAQSDGSHLKLL